MTIRKLFLFLLRHVGATVASLGRVVPAQLNSRKITRAFVAALVVGTVLTTLVAEAAAARGGAPLACDAATVADCSAENGESIGGVLSPKEADASCSSLQNSGFCDEMDDGYAICCSTNDEGVILDCKKVLIPA